MNKKNIIILLTLASLVTGLTACGKEKTETKTAETKDSNTVSGILESFSSGIVKMKSDEKTNPELSFEVKDATIECKNMLVGDEIVVVYEGTMNGTDTSSVKVKKVIDDGQNTAATETKTEATIVGTVVSASMNSIQIQTNDGQQYAFGTVGAEQIYKNGILEGNWITITYVGALKGTDTSGVKVIRIRDDDANVIQQEQAKMNIKAVDETVYATAGVHIRQSYSTDAAIVGSLAQGSSIQRTGVCDNGWSRVVFNGNDAFIYGDYLTTTAPVAPAPPATTQGAQPGTPQTGEQGSSQPIQPPAQPAQDQPAAEPVAETNTLTGIVEDASMGSMTILVNDTALTFATGDATHNYKNGIQRGNEVIVKYTGTINDTDTSQIVVTSVEDTNENSTPTIKGTIEFATMNTITVTTEDGINITFALENATVNCANGITLGIPVIVTLDLGSAIMESNIFPATQIDDVQ